MWVCLSLFLLFASAPLQEARPFKTGLLAAHPEHRGDPHYQHHQIFNEEHHHGWSSGLLHLEREREYDKHHTCINTAWLPGQLSEVHVISHQRAGDVQLWGSVSTGKSWKKSTAPEQREHLRCGAVHGISKREVYNSSPLSRGFYFYPHADTKTNNGHRIFNYPKTCNCSLLQRQTFAQKPPRGKDHITHSNIEIPEVQ